MTAVYNSALLVMIVSTMLAAGLSANAGAIFRTLRNVELVVLVALTNLIAVGIAFNNDPDILAALTGINIVVLVIALVTNAYIARTRAANEAAEDEVEAPV